MGATAVRIPLRISKCDPAVIFKQNTYSLSSASSRSSIKSPSSVATASTPATWSRRRCVPVQVLPGPFANRAFSSKSFALQAATEANGNNGGAGREKESSGSSSQRKYIKYAVVGGVIGLAAVTFSDTARHYYSAIERSGRVLGSLAVCINDYRVTLKGQDQLPEDEYRKSLHACHQRCANRTLRVLERNGSIFIKLGQHLSSMGYLLPYEWTTTFIPLQDKCPVSSLESIQELLIDDTGHRMDELFESFSPEPIGAASLAQVHTATLKGSGKKVAVKVQHPALAEWVPLDLALTRFTFSMLKRFFPEYDLEWLSKEMDLSLPQELDFRNEARNATRTAEYFKKNSDTPLVIPDAIWSKRRILVMDFVSGHRPDDLQFLDSNGINRDEVSATLANIFNEMIFGEGAPLHCDPHGGNIAIRKNPNRRPNFDVILYDHGLYRDISPEMRRNYAKLWLAVIEADEPHMREYAHKVAGVTDEQFPLFASAITGRDYNVLLKKDVASARTESEKESITGALGDGMLQQLVELLGQVPRIILLILKTNDLTRSLDENLHTSQGPIRTFIILARYATRAVFQENMEAVRESAGSLLRPAKLWRFLTAWFTYLRVELKLSVYENVLVLKSRLGMQAGGH